MKITAVDAKVVDTETVPGRFRRQVLVRVQGEDGLSGLGEAWSGMPVETVTAAVEKTLAPAVLGQEAGRPGLLVELLKRSFYLYGGAGVIMCAISAIDQALWDLRARRLAAPLHELMGGACRAGVRGYASFPRLEGRQSLQREVERALEHGFRAVKLHNFTPREVEWARQALPAEYPLMVDVFGHWPAREVARLAGELERFNVLWLEEPIFPMRDVETLGRLGARLNIPLAAGENEYELEGFARLLDTPGLGYLQPEMGKIGPTLALKLGPLAELKKVTISPHNYLVGPAFYTSVHWCLTNFMADWHEVKWLPEGCGAPAFALPPLQDGEVVLPPGPGQGLAHEF